MSPTGRKVQEDVFRTAGLSAPVKIAILETPTGFEVNARHGWPERMERFYKTSFANFNPHVTRVPAHRRDGIRSTNSRKTIAPLTDQDVIYCGAGSPTYVARYLGDSLALDALKESHRSGTTLIFGSASVIAMGRHVLPVYEIFKAGADLYWDTGINWFGAPLTFVTHWNNQEGRDFDTTRCWMGRNRFKMLHALLPQEEYVVGSDEQTACIIDKASKVVTVAGAGAVTVIHQKNSITYVSGESFSLKEIGVMG